MESDELKRLIRARRAAYRIYMAHGVTCAVCRQVPYDTDPDEWTCEERDRIMAARVNLGRAVTTAARALGFNSGTAYERAHGMVT
jgi:hypothetical protein